MIGINLSADLKAFSARLDAFAKRQLPFAAAQALTAVARKAADAERVAMQRSLDRPTPFTLRAVAVTPARKNNPVAWVYIRPIQARYLAPSIVGGEQILGQGSRAVLKPDDIRLNQYGNIPRGALKRLLARPDVFVGPVTFKSGQVINGVWQRPDYGQRKAGGRGSKRNTQNRVGGARTGLKLLIQFADPVELKPRYRFGQATIATARREFPGELRRAMAKALATAR